MEKIVRRLFLTGVLVVGLAVSGLCLQTYAAVSCIGGTATTANGITTCTETTGSNFGATSSSTFSVTIDKVLTLSDVAGTGTINADITKVATGNIKGTVTSNSKYTISLKADEPNLVKDTTNKIPPSSSVTSGVNGWGIKKKNTDGTNATSYTGLTAADQTFFTSAAAAPNGTPTTFEVGVGVSPALPTGTYTTTVTVTAAVQP